MFKRFRKLPHTNSYRMPVALAYARSLSDDDWKRFKRAVDSYRKSDQILKGEDTDAEIGDIAESFIEQ